MSTTSTPASVSDSTSAETVLAASPAAGSADSSDPFSNPLPLISILQLWGINIVLGTFLWCFLFGRKGPPTLWDEESKKPLYCFGQSNYLIRIRTGNCTNNYDHKSTQLKFHILDEKKKKVGSIIIPPKWLPNYSHTDKFSNLPDVKMVQFYWSRAQKISGFNFIQASHTCRIPNSSIIVYDIDVRSQTYGLALRAIVGMRVESLQDSNEVDQIVPLKSIKADEDDIWLSPALFSFCHFTIVGLFYTSTVALIALIGPGDFSKEDITESTTNGVIAVPVSLLMSFILIYSRSYLRKSLYPFSGSELANFDMSWSVIWFLDAFAMAAYSFFETSQYEAASIDQWTYASIIGQLLTTMLMITIYLINFGLFKPDKREIKNDTAIFGNLNKKIPEKEVLTGLMPTKSPSEASIQSTGSTYFQKIVKDYKIGKVKSISAYAERLFQQHQ